MVYNKSKMEAVYAKLESEDVDHKLEVNSFVGWAISRLIKKYKTKIENSITEGGDGSEWDEHWELLKMMSIKHQEAILDEAYMSSCYSLSDMAMNLGGLTLVSPKFFSFGERLMEVVAGAVSDHSIVMSGNDCMELGRKLVQENIQLQFNFLECCKESLLDMTWKVDIYDELVKKVCNARFGMVLKAHKDRTIGRQGSKTSDQPLRVELKAKSSKSKSE